MNVRLCTIVAAGLVLVAAPAGRAQISAFDWAFEYTPFQGQAALQLDTVHISGPNNHDELLAPDVSAWVSTTAAVDAHVSVTAEFVNHDFELLFDAPVAFVGGQIHFPATGGSYPTGTYVLEFDVAAGQTFGFGVWSADASSGPGVADFHDLLFTPDTWLDVGQALDPRAGAAVPPPPGMPDFGSALGALGDLDGDARPDFAVGAPATGHVLAISGADGSTLLDIAGPPGFGAVLSGAGDVDGDGTPDILVGIPDADGAAVDAGRAEVRSGADGTLIFAVDGESANTFLGTAVASTRDVNHDGFADVLIGAPRGAPSTDAGYVLLLAGPDGTLLHRFDPEFPLLRFGAAVAGLGDADGDGTPDLLVAEPWWPRVFVFSGATYGTIAVADPGEFVGVDVASLAPIGDADGDGRPDFVWGLPRTDIVTWGKLWVCSGATGATIKAVTGDNPFDIVGSRVAGGDFDGDGVGDIAYATNGGLSGQAGRVRVASGASGFEVIHTLRSIPSDHFGAALASAGGLDDDAAMDLAIGAPDDGIGVRLLHALDGPGVPALSGTGDLTPGSPLTVTLEDARANAPVLLVVSPIRADLPAKGGVLVPLPSLVLPLASNASGGFSLASTWPAGIAGPLTVWMQAWISDPDGPQGFTASNGLGGMVP